MNATLSRNRNLGLIEVDENNIAVKRNTSIILSPSVIAGSQLTWSPFQNLQATLLTKYVGSQFLDNFENDNLSLDAYHVEDLRLTYSFKIKTLTGVELSLLVNNLFNAEYASNGYTWGTDAYYYPQATRNYMGMVTVRF